MKAIGGYLHQAQSRYNRRKDVGCLAGLHCDTLACANPNRASLGERERPGFSFSSREVYPSKSGTLFTVVNAYLAEELGPKLPVNSKTSPPDVAPFLGIGYSGWTFIVFVICFFANIVLLYRMYDAQFAGDPLKRILKIKHIFASSVGFVIWAYAIKSPFFASYYKSFVAFLAIGLFLILVSRIKPPLDNRPVAADPPVTQ